MPDHPDAARAINATINDMMQQPIGDADQILQGAVVWEDDDLEQIHAGAEEAQSLDAEPAEAGTEHESNAPEDAVQHED